jgi:hypothetical protein
MKEFDVRQLYGRVRWNLPFPLAINGNIKEYLPFYALADIDDKDKIKLVDGGYSPYTPTNETPRQQQKNLVDSGRVLGVPTLSELQIGDVKFFIPPTLTLSNEVTVQQTTVAGMDGTVKEIITLGDYRVNLKCFLTHNHFVSVEGSYYKYLLRNSEFPEKVVREIRDLFEQKKSHRVISPFLNIFNIQYLLITSMSFPELDGYDSIIPVELQGISDKPLEIRLFQP